MDALKILQLYDNVLAHDTYQFQISEQEICNGITSMADVYQPGMANLGAKRSNIANYNDPAHRCAYLHKYAAFHTVLVQDTLYRAIQMNHRLFYDIVFSQEKFSICCLGGGPGNDVIAVLAAMQRHYSYFPAAVTVVDYMENWKISFMSILRELGSGLYGAFGNNTYHLLDWRYVGANLLKSLSPEVTDSISSASLVTMIKFVSATSCKDTQNMINNIFISMKPGGLLLYIDNDAGGYHELMMNAAREYSFASIFGPFRHENYINENMKVKRFGYNSCFKTTVTVHILQKPLNYHRIRTFLDNSRYVPNFIRRVIYRSPPTSSFCPPIDSPLTPYIHDTRHREILDFSTDESLHDPNNNFRSPVLEIPQSPLLEIPQSRSPLLEIPQSPYNVPFRSCIASPIGSDIVNSPGFENLTPIRGTPIAKSKRGKHTKQGCLPLPVKRWRRHLSKKINKLKFRAAAVLKKSDKGNKHPVFRL